MKVTEISKGQESTYTTCNTKFYKYADDLALLIKASQVNGDKHFFTPNPRRLESLVDEYKIGIKNYRTTEIKWLDDIADNMWSLQEATIFIFHFDNLVYQPDFLKPEIYERPHSLTFGRDDKAVVDSFDRNELKERLIELSQSSDIDIYLSEPIIPVQEQINQRKRTFRINHIKDGIENISEKIASNEYRLSFIPDASTDIFLELAINSKTDSVIYLAEEEGYSSYDRVFRKAIWTFLKNRNIAIDRVPPVDFEGSSIDSLVDEESLKKEGIKKYIPKDGEIEKRNSLTAIEHYLKSGTTEYFNNPSVVLEIKNFIENHINSTRLTIKSLPSEIHQLKKSIVDDSTNRTIFIINLNDFLSDQNNYEFEIFNKLKDWVKSNNRELYYSMHYRHS